MNALESPLFCRVVGDITYPLSPSILHQLPLHKTQKHVFADVTAASKMVRLIIIRANIYRCCLSLSSSMLLHSSISGSCGFVICLIFLCGFSECVTIFVQMAIKMRSKKKKKEQHLSVPASWVYTDSWKQQVLQTARSTYLPQQKTKHPSSGPWEVTWVPPWICLTLGTNHQGLVRYFDNIWTATVNTCFYCFIWPKGVQQ